MIAHTQSWIVMPINNKLNVDQKTLLLLQHDGMRSSGHKILIKKKLRLRETLDCRLRYARYPTLSSCIICVEYFRCAMCFAEVRVEIKLFDAEKSEIEGIMLIITACHCSPERVKVLRGE